MFCCNLGLDLSGKDFPTPLIDQETEWQERDLLERLIEEQSDIAGRIGRLIEQSDLHEIFRRDGQRDRVADRFMKTIVRTIAEQERLILVCALIKVVAQFVMNRLEVLAGRVDANLQ